MSGWFLPCSPSYPIRLTTPPPHPWTYGQNTAAFRPLPPGRLPPVNILPVFQAGHVIYSYNMYMAVSILVKLLGPMPLAQGNTTKYELPSHLEL